MNNHRPRRLSWSAGMALAMLFPLAVALLLTGMFMLARAHVNRVIVHGV